MKRWMDFIERFVPDDARRDPDRLRRGRLIAGTALALALASAIGLAARMAIAEHHPAAVGLSAACTLLFAASPWLLRGSGSLGLTGTVVSSACFLLVFGVGWFVGGLEGPVLMAAPVLPILAVYVFGRRVGILAFLLALVATAAYAWAPRLGVELPRPSLTGLEEVTARGVILGLTLAVASLIVGLSETERIAAEKKLRRSEHMYRSLFEQSKDIVSVSTPAGRLVDVNQAGLDFWGADSKDEVLERDVRESYADPEQRKELLHRLEKQGYVRDHETVHLSPSGDRRILMGTTSTIRHDSGEVEFLLAILRDVTDRRHAAAEREALLAELTAKNSELEHFTSAVSHDLRAPLTTIRGFAALLRKLASDNESLDHCVTKIDRAAGRMGQMIDDLLELRRIGSHQQALAEIPLEEVARDAADLLAGRIAQAGTDFEIDSDLPTVLADSALVRTILQNLIENGVKFSAERPDPRVTVAARDSGGETVITVRDNGAGIAPEHHEKVFELFFTRDKHRGGSGVGLAAVKRAVELQGGRIWVESEGEGRGSTFCFTLPPVASRQQDT